MNNDSNIIRDVRELEEFSIILDDNVRTIIQAFETFKNTFNYLINNGFVSGSLSEQLRSAMIKINNINDRYAYICGAIKRDLIVMQNETSKIEKQTMNALTNLLSIDPTQFKG